jgi:hypothetical protein
MTGVEGIPWECRSSWQDDQLVVARSVAESGYLFIPWRVPGHGDLVLSTATLMVRERPYLLPVEVARGTLNRLRNQRAAWEMAGLVVGGGVDEKTARAIEALVQATTRQGEPERASRAADDALQSTLDAVAEMGRQYTEQALAIRLRNSNKLSTFFACGLGRTVPGEKGSQLLTASFNATTVPMSWSQVEPTDGMPDWSQSDAQLQWCQRNELKVCAGPLLKLDRTNLPDWLFLWEDDSQQIHRYVQTHLEAVVNRYRGKVHVWHAASGTNVTDALGLGEEQRLRLTVTAIETIRRVDARTPVIVSFDQPWAEYMSRTALDLAPLHFADALVRAELGLAGIGIELNLGYSPGGSLPRDLLDISLQIDRWALLGLPLVVSLTVPSSDAEDPRATSPAQVIGNDPEGGPTPQSQKTVVENVVSLLLAKQCVQGIIWNQLNDASPHEFPHGGLFDSQGIAKPVLQTLTSIRQKHLM